MSALFPLPRDARRSRSGLLLRLRSLLFAMIPALVLAFAWFQMGQWYRGRLLAREYNRVQRVATRYAHVLEWTLDRELAMLKSAALEGRSPYYGQAIWEQSPLVSEDGQFLEIRLRVRDLWGQSYLIVQQLPLQGIMQASGLGHPPEGLTLAVLDSYGRPLYGPNMADLHPTTSIVRLPETFWFLAAVPTEGWARAIRGELWWLQGAMGLFFCAILAGTHMALRRQRHLVADVDSGAAALKLSEDSFQHLFNLVPDPLLVVTLDGQLLSANGQARQRFGLDRQWPANLADLLHARGLADDATLRALLSPQDDVCLLPLRMSSHDAPQRYFETTTTHFTSGQGGRRLLIVLHDVTNQYLGQQALRASEARYKALVENSPEGVLLCNLEGRISVANLQAAELAGYTSPDSMLRTVHRLSDLVDRSDREPLAVMLLRVLAEGAVRGHVFTLVRRDGVRLPAETSIARLIDDAGQASGFVVAMQDVTIRRRAQAHNHAYRERLSMLARALSALIDMPDEQRTYDAITQTFVELAGARASYLSLYDQDQRLLTPCAFSGEAHVQAALTRHVGSTMLGKAHRVPDALHLSLRQRGLQRLAGLTAMSVGLVRPEDDARVRRQMGVGAIWGLALARHDITLGAVPLLMADDAPIQFPEVVEAYAHAVTTFLHRQRSARTLRESEERHRSLMTNLGDALVIVDEDLRIVDYRDTSSRLFGSAHADVQGAAFPLCFAPLIEQGLTEQRLRAAIQSERNPRRMSYLNWPTKDGEMGYLDAAMFPIRLEGRPHLAILMRDVTERHDLTQQLWQHERLEDLGRFAAGAAHDLRHVVALISHEIPLLEQAIDDDNARAMAILRMLQRAVLLGEHLTTTLVDYNHGREPVLGPLHINVMLRLERQVMHEILGDQIVLQLDLSQELVFCLADDGLFERAWLNLLINARDAMPAGGRVTMATRLQVVSDDETQAQGLAPGPYGVLSVTDTGSGMTEYQIERVFDPFFSTKQTSLAAGLGLAVVKRVMEQHHGTVMVSSELGRGTTFELYFPAISQQEIDESMAELTIDANLAPA